MELISPSETSISSARYHFEHEKESRELKLKSGRNKSVILNRVDLQLKRGKSMLHLHSSI